MDIDGKKLLKGAVIGKPLVTALGADKVTIADASDGWALKSALVSDFLDGGGDMVLADVQTVTGEKTFDSSKLKLAGATSGSTILNAAAAAGAGTVSLPTTGTLATLAGAETLSGKTLTTPVIASIIDLSSNEMLVLSAQPSAVNYVTIANAGTGVGPLVLAAGDDANINLRLAGKGTGSVSVTSNVGIGLTDPQDTLEVAGTTLISSPTHAGATNYLRTSISTSDAGAIAITGERGGTQAAVNGDITITPIGTGNTIFASGNVGIGTANPAAPLSVSGTAETMLSLTSTYAFPTLKIAGTSGTGTNHEIISFRQGAAQKAVIGYDEANEIFTVGGASANNDYFVVKTQGASVGNVGIGIAAPTSRLHVDQSSAAGAIPVIHLDQADVSEEIFEVTSTAGVGNAVEAVGAKTLTTTGFIKWTVNGATVYVPFGTIA